MQRSQDTVNNNWRKPWYCAFIENALFHQSLIVKSKQNLIELVTRPGLPPILNNILDFERYLVLTMFLHGWSGSSRFYKYFRYQLKRRISQVLDCCRSKFELILSSNCTLQWSIPKNCAINNCLQSFVETYCRRLSGQCDLAIVSNCTLACKLARKCQLNKRLLGNLHWQLLYTRGAV